MEPASEELRAEEPGRHGAQVLGPAHLEDEERVAPAHPQPVATAGCQLLRVQLGRGDLAPVADDAVRLQAQLHRWHHWRGKWLR